MLVKIDCRSKNVDVSNELSSLREKYQNITSQRQLPDVAYLVDIVEGLKSEVQGLRTSLDVTGSGNRYQESIPISVIQTGNRSMTSLNEKIDQVSISTTFYLCLFVRKCFAQLFSNISLAL